MNNTCEKCGKEEWGNTGLEGRRVGTALTFEEATKQYCECKNK